MTNQLNKALSKIFRNTKIAITLASLTVITSVTAVHAAPYPTGTLLSIDAGVGSTTNTPCTTGSCFGMDVAPGLVIWTDILPGSAGGIVVGSNQASGGQELGPSSANSETGQVTAAWNFFGNFGTNYTPTGAANNLFDDAGCAVATCPGVTALGSWHVAWNGTPVPMGSAAGCNSASCNANQLAGRFITNYTASGAGGGAYTLEFQNVVPNGDASSFGNVIYTLILRGTVTVPDPLTQTGATSIGDGTTVSAVGTRVTSADLDADFIALDSASGGVESLNGIYYDFDINIGGNPGGNAVVTIPLTVPLPASPIYRKYDSATTSWVTFASDGVNNLLESAPGSLGNDCTAVAWVAGLIEGSYCARVTIQDNGVNDDDPITAGTIKDPAGFGTGNPVVTTVAADTRTSGNSGCSIAGTPTKLTNHLDWVLLLGFMSWLGLRRNKWFTRKNS